MPFKTSWIYTDRLILIELEGIVTSADIRGFSVQAFEMIAVGKPLVHAVVDARKVSKLESIPESIKAVQATPIHPNGGWYIIVGTLNPMITFTSDFVATIMRARYRRFDTMQEALNFIKERDETLHDMPITLS